MWCEPARRVVAGATRTHPRLHTESDRKRMAEPENDCALATPKCRPSGPRDRHPTTSTSRAARRYARPAAHPRPFEPRSRASKRSAASVWRVPVDAASPTSASGSARNDVDELPRRPGQEHAASGTNRNGASSRDAWRDPTWRVTHSRAGQPPSGWRSRGASPLAPSRSSHSSSLARKACSSPERIAGQMDEPMLLEMLERQLPQAQARGSPALSRPAS